MGRQFVDKLEIRQIAKLWKLRCPRLIGQETHQTYKGLTLHKQIGTSVLCYQITPPPSPKPAKNNPHTIGGTNQAGPHLRAGNRNNWLLIPDMAALKGCALKPVGPSQQPIVLLRPAPTCYNTTHTVCVEPLPVGGPLWDRWGVW